MKRSVARRDAAIVIVMLIVVLCLIALTQRWL